MKAKEGFLDELMGGLAFFKEGIGAKGLVRDRWPRQSDLGSIASDGFALASFAIGAHYGLMEKEEARRLSLQILEGAFTLERDHGFFYHFSDLTTGEKKPWAELSDIDSALFFLGALTAGNYFGGEVEGKAHALVDEADWPYWVAPDRPQLFMGKAQGRFYAYWQDYAEQLMIYVLAAGAENPAQGLSDLFYKSFARPKGSYRGEEFVRSHTNGLFVYLYSQLFIDFRGKKDGAGTDWHENSRRAILADYAYCRDNAKTLPSYAQGWGLSACDGKEGYSGDYGTLPGVAFVSDGTVALYAAVSSLPFAEKEALEAYRYYRAEKSFQCRYGFIDSYNLGNGFRADGVIGIDKGAEMIGMADYLDGFVWGLLTKERRIARGLAALGLK